MQVVDTHSNWKGFCPKLAKWICLCENYPYRMSLLVLFITDFVQKEIVNKLHSLHPSRSEYGLVYYKKSAKGLEADLDKRLELKDDMPIVEAYFRHVERYIYSHNSARHMLSLDGDPVSALSARGHIDNLMRHFDYVVQEMFTALLMQPISDLSESENTLHIQAAAGRQQSMCDITISDILGPWKDLTQRDANFSLLSYSFNLVGSSGSLELETQ